ncbi:hypothetical protein ACVOMV_26125 (plasmid) [Mesorhizobium atlanticum]|uniref:hypothetical protein n=1 Tax=Mesorhizobium atlanticum TaxID=2233532 RepID=UPI0037039363
MWISGASGDLDLVKRYSIGYMLLLVAGLADMGAVLGVISWNPHAENRSIWSSRSLVPSSAPVSIFPISCMAVLAQRAVP